MNVPVPVYGEVPPVAETVTEAEPPLHAMLPAEEEAESTAGCVIVPVATDVQPLASVTV